MELWLHQGGNGPGMEDFLPQYSQTVLCCLRQRTNSRKLSRHRKNAKNILHHGTWRKLQIVIWGYTNIQSLQTSKLRHKNVTLRFSQQSLSDGKLRELFLLRRKQHGHTQKWEVSSIQSKHWKVQKLSKHNYAKMA